MKYKEITVEEAIAAGIDTEGWYLPVDALIIVSEDNRIKLPNGHSVSAPADIVDNIISGRFFVVRAISKRKVELDKAPKCCEKMIEEIKEDYMIEMFLVDPLTNMASPGVYFCSDGGHGGMLKINFCPFCGTKIELGEKL
jgi:hypothetical protein